MEACASQFCLCRKGVTEKGVRNLSLVLIGRRNQRRAELLALGSRGLIGEAGGLSSRDAGPGMQVKVIVHEAEEGGFWAEVPALPGCVSQGAARVLRPRARGRARTPPLPPRARPEAGLQAPRARPARARR